MTAPTAPGPEVRAQRLVELTLTGLTVAAVLGLGRLFDAASFFAAVLAFAFLGHGLAFACRTRRLGGWASAVVGLVGLVLGVSWFLLAHTTAYLLPTGATVDEFGHRLAEAWDVFGSVRAPAPVHPGLVLAAAVATYVIAWVADTAAFRASAPVEAAVPATSLFLFGAALGAPPLRAPSTAVFIGAFLAYWLATRAWRSTASPGWASHQSAGAGTLLASGGRLAGVAVVGALVIGPLLPGAGAGALLPWRASDRDSGTRLTVSPLVDIRARIVDQAEVEVFTVRSAQRSYWRLTALDEFDGRIWRSEGRFRSAARELADPGEVQPAAAGGNVLVDQQVEIHGLDAVWLPAAFRPVAFATDAARVGVDEESSTLIIGRDESSEGLRYDVQSFVRHPSADELRRLSTFPREVSRDYTRLPATFSPEARNLAGSITAGAATPYDKARALQDHFRSGAYRYDTAVDPGHGEDDLERFLFETRAGYCEQFAGAYAALARSVGLPARVAVGFTPGELGADGSYHVLGSHGHAWPEVFLGGAGWVPFEPTPGRGIPGGEGYTGVAEQQAGPDGDQAVPSTTTSTSTTVAAGAPTTAPPSRLLEDQGGGGEGAGSPWPGRLAWTAAALVAAAGGWVLLVVTATWLRRWRRRRAARTTSGRVLVAWDEVGEALAGAGVARRPAETPLEYADRAAGTAGADPPLLRALAERATEAGWAPDAVDEEVAVRAVAAATVLERGLRGTRTPRERLSAAVDPRPLLPRRTERVVIRELATPRA